MTTEEINRIRKEAIYAINKVADEALKQTPKLGDWVESNAGSIIKIKEIKEGKLIGFGILKDEVKWAKKDWFHSCHTKRILTESEVIDFLTKEADKKYNEGDNIKNTKGITFKLGGEYNGAYTGITENNNVFCYKGIYVLDLETGEWAEVVKKEEDWDVEFGEKGYILHWHSNKTYEKGKYKLIKI